MLLFWMHSQTLIMEMACHCWIVSCSICASVVVSCTSLSTLCFSWSHKCSNGFKSGEQAGHSMTVIPFCTFAVLALALSSWRIKFCPICWAKGCTWGVRISLMYHLAFNLPLILTSCVLPVTLIPAHTIMLPPPYAVFCWTLLTLWWVHYECWWADY